MPGFQLLQSPSRILSVALFLSLNASAWAGQIYLLESRGSQSTNEGQYSFRSLGTVDGARKVTVPETGAHVLVLTEDGDVRSWTRDSSLRARGEEQWSAMEGLSAVVGIAAGTLHSAALRSDGTVWTWGANDRGQLGNAELVSRLKPGMVAGLSQVFMIAAGRDFTLALRSDGTVWGFGSNWSQILAGDAEKLVAVPVQVQGLRDVKSIAVHGNRGYARDGQGRVWVWGSADADAEETASPQVLGTEQAAGIRFADEKRESLESTEWLGLLQQKRSVSVRDSLLALSSEGREATYTFDGNVLDVDLGWAVAMIVNPEGSTSAVSGETTLSGSAAARVKAAGYVAGAALASAEPRNTGAMGVVSASGSHAFYVKSDGTACACGRVDGAGVLGDGSSVNRSTYRQITGVPNPVAIAGAGAHTLALSSSGTVYAWGDGTYGRLGDGSGYDRPTPFPLTSLTGVVSVAAGQYHSMAVKSDGTVWTWGYNGNGRLGDGTSTNRSTPVFVVGFSGASAVAAGDDHSMALKSDGTVWTWGYNGYGQLGDGSYDSKANPVQVVGLDNIIAITAGSNYSLALRSDGTVWGWGQNSNGQLGDGSTTGRPNIVRVTDLTGVIGIAASAYHSLAVKSDGTVWAWGYNGYGELGDSTTVNKITPVRVFNFTGAVAVAAGTYFSMAMRSDGSIWSWGNNESGQLGLGNTTATVIPFAAAPCASNVYPAVTKSPFSVRLTAGHSHVMAVTTNGGVSAWGLNTSGQLGDGTTINRPSPIAVSGLGGVIAVDTGNVHTLALTVTGTVRSWGNNTYGRLGDGTTIDRLTPTTTLNLAGVTGISAGMYHSMAVKSDGTVWTWGYNGNGRLGDGTSSNRSSPVAVVGFTNAIAVSAGDDHSMALRSDGTVWAWGYNGYGQLGDGTYTSKANPVQVAGLTNVIAISAGANYSLALKSDGTVWGWGQNSNGQLGDGSTEGHPFIVRVSDISGIVSIAAGVYHSVAVRNDGTIWSWGFNGEGALGDTTTVNRVTPVPVYNFTGGVAAAAGIYFSTALRTDGYVWSWGDNTYGQFASATPADSTVPIRAGQVGYIPPPSSVRGDFNADGKTDLIWQNDATRDVYVWYLGGLAGNTYQGSVQLSGSVPGWRVVGTGDFNGDAKPDLVWQSDTTRDLQVWYMSGPFGNIFSGSASLSGGPVPGWRCVGIADYNGDNKPDLLWQNDANRDTHVWYMGGPQGTVYLGGRSLSGGGIPGWTVKGGADFNGDGFTDLLWQSDTTRDLQVWYLAGAPGHAYLGSSSLSGGPVPGWTVRGTADFNGDGKPDIVWQNDASRDTHVWYMGGPFGNAYLGGLSVSNGPVPGWTSVE